MTGVILALLAVILSNLFLYIGYRYYEFHWPEDYFGLDNKESIFLTIKPYYYFIFRLLPVFIVVVIFVGSFIKLNPSSFDTVLVGGLTGLVFSLINDGKALIYLYKKSKEIKKYRNSYFQYIIHFLTILLLVFTGMIAGLFLKIDFVTEWFIPDIKSLRDNIYASFIAIVISFGLYKLAKKPKETTVSEMILKRTKEISNELISQIEQESRNNNADPILVKAICISENMERPSWIRMLENILGLFKKRGTYGIMQVESSRPLSDKESIRLSIIKYFRNTLNPTTDKIAIIRNYNNDDKYVDLVLEIYRTIN